LTEDETTAELPVTDADEALTSAEEMTPEQLAEAKRYGRQSLALGLADTGLDILYLGVMAVWFAAPLGAWFEQHIDSASLRVLAMFASVYGLHECVSLPLAYFSGFVFEHRYGLSQQTRGRWFRQHFKQYFLSGAFNAVIFLGLFWVFWTTGDYWWITAAAISIPVAILLGTLAPVLIVPLLYKTERLDDEELSGRMRRLADDAGLEIEGIYRLVLSEDTVKANAMLAGMGRTRRVMMGDTLLERFTPAEIEVVFAHEMGHHVHRHIPKLIAWMVVSVAASFWLCDLAFSAWIGPAYDPAQLPVWTLPVLMLLLNVLSLVTSPVLNIVSRHFERQCDRYALDQTADAASYRSAFRKLAKLNKDDPQPNPVAVFLFHNHPPISERLAMADE
jgi:STE24 endopeptidase